MNHELLKWLKQHRRDKCPKCEPNKQFPYNLIKTTRWCPQCDRIWRYIYVNPQNTIKKAIRYWQYADNIKERFKL